MSIGYPFFLFWIFHFFSAMPPLTNQNYCLRSAIDSCGRVLLTDGSTEDVVRCY